MQLVSLTLYSPTGESKTIPFELGRLNVITGQSKTGKSVLVKLIDYCFGRSEVPTSAGRVQESLAWVAAVWQFENGSRAFVGRPMPADGRKTTERCMVVFGDETLGPLPFESLAPNGTTDTMRLELGHQIGMTESRTEVPDGSLRSSTRTTLGHAALLCIQNQDEISNSTRIFHRQGDPGINDALRDSIPYFLGAVAPDQAIKRAQLRQERRRLARAEQAVAAAEDATKEIDAEFRALMLEAVEAGLTEVVGDPLGYTRSDMLATLHRIRRPDTAVDQAAAIRSVADQDQRRTLTAALQDAEMQLDRLMSERALLLDEQQYGGEYVAALETQVGRLSSLNLLPDPAPSKDADTAGDAGHDTHGDEQECPVCGVPSRSTQAAKLRDALKDLRSSLSTIRGNAPARSEALEQLNQRITAAQSEVIRSRSLLEATLGAAATVGSNATRRADYTRGRIDAILSRAPQTEDATLMRLRNQVSLAMEAVRELEDELSDEHAQARLNARMRAVSEVLTEYARGLGLEHSDDLVELDLANLTVVTMVNDTPVPLARIGSAENWIGYHVATHLALHHMFITHDGPVPRLLVIDQPSQGHYPSEMAKRTGKAENDADEAAVRNLYELMHNFTEDKGGEFQIIAVDHADIDRNWFQDAIVDNWRGEGKGLIPDDWFDDDLG